MKKRPEARRFVYLLRIKYLNGKDWITPIPCKSLREAVEGAAQYVQNMDSYKKVYRDFNSLGGSYVACFFSNPNQADAPQHFLIQVIGIKLLTHDEIEEVIQALEIDKQAASELNF